MHSIRDWGQKIKVSIEDGIGQWGMAILVILVGCTSFGLGRLSALEDAKPAVSISQAASAAIPALPAGGMYEASRSGAVYYFPWCSGALKIGQNDQIWFSSEAQAQKAGYRPAKNCKGLSF